MAISANKVIVANGPVGGDNIQHMKNSLVEIDASGNIIIPKTAGTGIQVDIDSPTFGFDDIIGQIRTRGVGATDPNDATYIGGIKAYNFDVNDEAWIDYHINHDYVIGTDIFLHFHWSHNVTVVTGGSVTWGYEMTYAKGHGQAPFSAAVSGSVVADASTTQYQQQLDEVQISAASPSGSQIDSDFLEPDGVIMMRVFLSANNITSSAAVPDPFLHFADIHYQTKAGTGTKNKAPDFYA